MPVDMTYPTKNELMEMEWFSYYMEHKDRQIKRDGPIIQPLPVDLAFDLAEEFLSYDAMVALMRNYRRPEIFFTHHEKAISSILLEYRFYMIKKYSAAYNYQAVFELAGWAINKNLSSPRDIDTDRLAEMKECNIIAR